MPFDRCWNQEISGRLGEGTEEMKLIYFFQILVRLIDTKPKALNTYKYSCVHITTRYQNGIETDKSYNT